MNRKLIWLSAITLIITLGQPSFACSGDSKHCNAHHRSDKLAKELNLTPEQEAKLQTYKEKAQANFKTNYAQLRTLRTQINTLIQSNKMDEAKLDSLIEQVNKIRGSMLKNKVMMQHQMFTILDTKQKAKFLELKKKWYLDHNV
ncbi:Spy/CpxP family protein refolding chaperone [Legionella cincinnatiensis]|uniref:Envelope stress induced periplasmic protein n=1 Tax=Legionella cincinnatiensis TaxID=28085 RepID=A0A378IT77_9GAMM|nr:Spy/CpxP family protein refolding chaperone [Legionella cincinnatiensis]KTC78606.1 envelope stress induced periplasmic protein [Legionella cincinnatiensis]STX35194.1 envelope stress induced periplasmic protein [Legionella cincinnatiensis]